MGNCGWALCRLMSQVDDTVWTEIKNFIKCLVQMYAAQVCVCVPQSTTNQKVHWAHDLAVSLCVVVTSFVRGMCLLWQS